MHIVFAADQAFVRQLLVASGSAVYACRNGGGANPLVVHVLDCGIEEATWNDYASRITRLAERVHVKTDLVRHAIDMKQFENFNGWTNGSKATWARLLIPNLLPDVDQCVYSDCDMLFIANPVEMLEPLREPDVYIAGHHEPMCEAGYSESEWCQQKGLPFDPSLHFCAGLLAMNLAAFRTKNLVGECLDFAARYPDAPLLDQTNLNSVCFDHRALLPDGWGIFMHECHSFNGRIKAIHMAGGLPWKKVCASYNMAIALRLSKTECALWRDFESKVLGVTPSVAAEPSPRIRRKASLMLLATRITNLLHVKIGRARLQRIVTAYDGRSTALVTARQDLFGDL